MAEVSPFPGIRYNKDKVKDLAAVICPPYDVISPQEQKAYYEKSEYNMVRLEHGMELPDDDEANNKRSRAAATFNRWLLDGVLKADAVGAFYIHEYGFEYRDVLRKRVSLIAAVKLEPWESNIVFPHEHTVSGVKKDRLQLMRACNANLSPILGLYEDPGGRVSKLLLQRMTFKPLIDFVENGDTHRLWMGNEPEFVQRISHFMASKSIYIADGHHRYETALAYREERQKHVPSCTGDAAFNFIMMEMVSFSDPGLLVLPIHRLVKHVSSRNLDKLRSQLPHYFEMQSLPIAGAGLPDFGMAIGVLGLEPGNLVALKPRPSGTLKTVMPANHSDAYAGLDVSILQHLIIEKLVASPDKSVDIGYTIDIGQAWHLVESGQFQMAFLLNPIPVTTIKTVADASDRMPRKSTYFYPKPPAGLVINRLQGEL